MCPQPSQLANFDPNLTEDWRQLVLKRLDIVIFGVVGEFLLHSIGEREDGLCLAVHFLHKLPHVLLAHASIAVVHQHLHELSPRYLEPARPPMVRAMLAAVKGLPCSDACAVNRAQLLQTCLVDLASKVAESLCAQDTSGKS